MSLPPILPPPAPAAVPAAPRAQPRKPPAPKKAEPPPPPAEKPARKPRGTPPERAGPFPSSWPCASLQRQQPRRPAPAPPQPRGRSCETLCAAAGPEAAAGEAALRFSLSLPPEAALLLQRRSLEKQRERPSPSAGTERLLPGSRGKAAPAAGGAARRGGRPGPGSGPGDLRALLKISLLNERHRYDDVEYEEEAAPGAAADEGLVRKCTEWLRGVESAAGRDRADKLETLPHLGAL